MYPINTYHSWSVNTPVLLSVHVNVPSLYNKQIMWATSCPLWIIIFTCVECEILDGFCDVFSIGVNVCICLCVQLGAAGFTSRQSVLRRPQHQNHNLGETTATRVCPLQDFICFIFVCLFSFSVDTQVMWRQLAWTRLNSNGWHLVLKIWWSCLSYLSSFRKFLL